MQKKKPISNGKDSALACANLEDPLEKCFFFLPFVSLLSVETVSLFHLLLFMHMNSSQVPAIIGVNLVTRLFVELRRAMLSTCEYSRLPHSPRLLVEPVETRAEATGVFAL